MRRCDFVTGTGEVAIDRYFVFTSSEIILIQNNSKNQVRQSYLGELTLYVQSKIKVS